VKIHKAHKLTPAMASEITDKLWSVEDIVALVEASEPKPSKRGACSKREQRRTYSLGFPLQGSAFVTQHGP
jgi:hypothetical protein